MKKQFLEIECHNLNKPGTTDILKAVLNQHLNYQLTPVLKMDEDSDAFIPMPTVTIQFVTQRGIDDFTERKHRKCIDGYSIKMANNVLFNVFFMEDGTHEYENLYSDLLTLAGNATSQASYLRGAVQNANGFAHTVKNYVETYQNFFGPLTDDHKKWMAENTISFEQAIELAQQKAKLNSENNSTDGKEK